MSIVKKAQKQAEKAAKRAIQYPRVEPEVVMLKRIPRKKKAKNG